MTPPYSEDDIKLAEHIGELFGGNGLTHREQVLLVAERLAEWRSHCYLEGVNDWKHAKDLPPYNPIPLKPG